jgi:chorismate synthase
MIEVKKINKELLRRQGGYGRSLRMRLEQDKIEILSGLRGGKTIGSPIALRIENKDFKIDRLSQVRSPRPGHADLAGAIKYNQSDIRDVLERASARETAARVAIGAICKLLLGEFKIELLSHVIEIKGIKAHIREGVAPTTFKRLRSASLKSSLFCADKVAERLMIKEIDRARRTGDTVGGIFEIIVINLPIGLGSHTQWDRRLDGRLAQALFSIPGIKGVELGLGFKVANRLGSQVHDEIYYKKGKGFLRRSNNAGGIEGGMTNGEPITLRCVMKPISTLRSPLKSVDILSKKSVRATVERSDICVVPAAGVIGEAVVAIELARAMLEKFGGDSLGEMKRNYQGYLKQVREF